MSPTENSARRRCRSRSTILDARARRSSRRVPAKRCWRPSCVPCRNVIKGETLTTSRARLRNSRTSISAELSKNSGCFSIFPASRIGQPEAHDAKVEERHDVGFPLRPLGAAAIQPKSKLRSATFRSHSPVSRSEVPAEAMNVSRSGREANDGSGIALGLRFGRVQASGYVSAAQLKAVLAPGRILV